MNPRRQRPATPISAAVASMTFSNNPLVGPPAPVEVQPFTPVGSLAPKTRSGVLMLKVNGEWLLRKDWGRIVVPGDVIEWHEVPQGGNASRGILTAVLLIVIAIYQPELIAAYGKAGAAAVSIGATVIGTAVINALVPLQTPNLGGAGSTASPGSVYNVSASANQARLGQPIPVIYGRHRVFPDYACQPYIEYRDNDQYFHAVYCIGQGAYCGAGWIDDAEVIL